MENTIKNQVILSANGVENKKGSFITFQLQSTTTSHELQDVVRHWEEGKIKIPDIQRPAGEWKSEQKKTFIDSLINGYPIPPLMVVKKGTQKLLIDGQQRLSTVISFIGGKFKTLENDNKSEISKKSFAQLPNEVQEKLKQSEILIQYVQNSVDPNDVTFIFEIFKRINTGSLKLTEIQVLMATYYGEFSKWLKEFASSKDDILMSKTKSVTVDQKLSIILRIISFYFYFKINNGEVISQWEKKTISSSDILKKPMDEYWNFNDFQLQKIQGDIVSMYEQILEGISEIGINNLCSINANGDVGKDIQQPTLDAFVIMISNSRKLDGFKTLSKRIVDSIKNDNNFIKYKELFQEQTLSIVRINERVNFIENENQL